VGRRSAKSVKADLVKPLLETAALIERDLAVTASRR
jgi:hypothetical protein